jgi:hypothetical protein
MFILGWTPRGELRLRLRLLLGPWPDSSILQRGMSSSPSCLRWRAFGGGPSAGGIVTADRSQHQEGGCLSLQVFAPGPLGGRSTQGADYGRILVAATPVGECPGMMVTAARRVVATSDGGGRHGASLAIRRGFSYSPYSSLIFLAHTFMLPLEVMGLGGSLSTSLAATLNGETPVGECPGRRHGDGGIQLRPDSGGAQPLGRGR